MNTDILFVDDEKNILDSFRLNLRKKYRVDTALGPLEGLEKIKSSGPFAVIVSDLKMPDMDGIQFLSKVQELAPDTVRVMLTGHADLESAILAVNSGHVFRFLTKPAAPEDVIRTLDAAIHQHALIVGEKELLRGTLRGIIRVLTDLLGLISPEAFGRSERARRLAMGIAKELNIKNTLNLDLAAMLCQLGCISLPGGILDKVSQGQELSAEDKQLYIMHPQVAAMLLANIPRLDKPTEIIRLQDSSLVDAPHAPMEARILKTSLDYDLHIQRGKAAHEAIDLLRQGVGVYAPLVVDALERFVVGQGGTVRRTLALADLKEGMILDEPLLSKDNVMIMAKGQEIGPAALLSLQKYTNRSLPEKVKVLTNLGERIAPENSQQ